MEQDFHGNFRVNVTWFFAFFSGVLDWIVLILVWFERSLHFAHVSGQRCPWPLKLMMSQVVEGTCIRMGGYRQLRGEWINKHYLKPALAIRISLLQKIIVKTWWLTCCFVSQHHWHILCQVIPDNHWMHPANNNKTNNWTSIAIYYNSFETHTL